MIFSKTIQNIKSNKQSYQSKPSMRKGRGWRGYGVEEGSEEEDEGEKMHSAALIRKNIHKVIVVNSEKKRLPLELNKGSGGALIISKNDDDKWQHDRYKGPPKQVERFTIFLRNLSEKVREDDLKKLIGTEHLLGTKVSVVHLTARSRTRRAK